MYSFMYYTNTTAPEATLPFASNVALPPYPSPTLSSSTAGKSDLFDNDFSPYEYCSIWKEVPNELDYEPFGQALSELSLKTGESSWMGLYPSSLVEVKDEFNPDEDPVQEGDISAPTNQDFVTFGDLKMEEVDHDTDSSIMVDINVKAPPTPKRVKKKVSRDLHSHEKDNKVAPTVHAKRQKTKSTEESAVEDKTGETEMESDSIKLISSKKRLYEMSRDECSSEKQWSQVKRAKNTFNFHEKQRKKIFAAEEIMEYLMTIPAAVRATYRNPKIKGIVSAYFPQSINK